MSSCECTSHEEQGRINGQKRKYTKDTEKFSVQPKALKSTPYSS